MNFFTHQDQARSATRKLVVLFVGAIVALIAVTSILVAGLLFFANGSTSPGAGIADFNILNSDLILKVALAVIAVVALGAQFRMLQLRGGGKTVAEAMGGRLLNLRTKDADERRLMNVVEEISIAAGLPVPPVYLLEDPAINAFAAGYKPQDAVIGVTRGCIQQLNRDELQGVIAHEFSHIFYGDMRLNIRLIGLLYGIMVIGLIGYFLMRGSTFSAHRNKKGGGIIFLGLGLAIIGYGGTFFGNMIKAAVSRQREFLADASAVQFTRNPTGISNALKKIGGYTAGSRLTSGDVSEISHMLFGEGVKAGFTGLFATHPPLKERIKKIEPGWNGDFKQSSVAKSGTNIGVSSQTSGFTSTPASVLESIGNPTMAHVDLAVAQIALLPEVLRDEAHSTFGACALMYSLLIECSGKNLGQKQLALLKNDLPVAQYRELLKVKARVTGLARELYIPLIDLALPSLKQLSSRQYQRFMTHLDHLITADDNISLFEWSLFQILKSNLEAKSRIGRLVNIENSAKACEILLSALAGAGHAREADARKSFSQGKDMLGLSQEITYKSDYINNIQELEKAIGVLVKLKPLQKPFLLKAMVKCIDDDGKAIPEESELLRAVGNLLDCPIPPVLSNQRFI